MTKEEAIELMLKGKKLTHHYFEPHEWMTMEDHNTIKYENGTRCTSEKFWVIRSEEEWEDSWSLWE